MTPAGRNRTRAAVAVAAILAIVTVGAGLVRVGRPDRRPSPERLGDAEQASETNTGASTSSTRVDAGPGESDDPGEDEAVAAAVRYAAAPQAWLYLPDDEIAAAVSEIATPEAAERLTDETVTEVASARGDLARSTGRVWWLVHPMAWRVDSYRGDAATVAVWTMTLLSASDVALPQTEWVTNTFDLRFDSR